MQASGITDNKADVCACIVCLPDRSSAFVPIRAASFYQHFLQFLGAETVRDMKGSKKTNAARILDGLAISYELREFPVDLADLSAVHAAEMLGMPVGQVFKTLVCHTDISRRCWRSRDISAAAARRWGRRRSIPYSSMLRRMRGRRSPSAQAGAASRSYLHPLTWSVPFMRRRRI